MSFRHKLSRIVRWARITKAAISGQQFPAQQVSYLGKTADCTMVFPYGLFANLPPDVLALMFSVQGNPDNRAAIPVTTKDRPSDTEGDVSFFNPINGGYVIWRADGTLDIKTGNGGVKNVNVDGKEFNLTATDVFNVDSPATNLGVGGLAIARIGDSVQIVIPSGSSAGTYNGVITSGGDNTSI